MLTIEMVVAWAVTTLALLWAVGSFCVAWGRHMELQVREELAAKRRRERQ